MKIGDNFQIMLKTFQTKTVGEFVKTLKKKEVLYFEYILNACTYRQ